MSTFKDKDPDSSNYTEFEIAKRFTELTGDLENPALTQGGPRDYQIQEDDGAFIPPEGQITPIAPKRIIAWILFFISITGLTILGLVQPDSSRLWASICFILLIIATVLAWTSLKSKSDME